MFFDASETGSDPYLSSDAMAGAAPMSTLHGDYMFGASPDVNEGILRCVREARSCGFEGGRGQLPDRFFGPDGRVYENSVSLSDGVDRTPFGNTLTPVLQQAGGSNKLSHHHMHHGSIGQNDKPRASFNEAVVDLFSLSDEQWLGTLSSGSMLHRAPNGEAYFELKLAQHVTQSVGSVEIVVNDGSAMVDNEVPFLSIGDNSASIALGAILVSGENRIRARLYEQDDLGGSYLGEVNVTFTVH
ncbi:MAG: hypothetical protein AAFN91_04655 [Pseudomonadota bacterium]